MIRTLAVMVLVLSGCPERFSAERGRALFGDPDLAGVPSNETTCSTCHATSASDPRLLPGAGLAGVISRESYWGGEVTDLRAAINVCLFQFMRATSRTRLSSTDPDGLDLLAYLESLGEGNTAPLAFSLPSTLETDVAAGDVDSGASLYERGCRSCHGDASTGTGRPSAQAPVIPTDTVAEHMEATEEVFIAKLRHGSFYGIGGNMPPFSTEVLSDQDVRDLVSFLLSEAGLPETSVSTP